MKKSFRFVLSASSVVLASAVFAQTTAGPEDGAPQATCAKCLPAGIKLSNVVQVVSGQKITVEQKLRELTATCNGANQLIDGNGRPIAFYHLQGCWGHPPPNYQEIMQKQQREIAALKQRHTVIEMTCNPSGVHVP